MNTILEYIQGIEAIDEIKSKQMETYLDGLTKPVGSLGKLEEIMMRLAGIQRTMKLELDPKITLIMCSDNGVCKHGVSECPQEVTRQVTTNFTKGLTGINKLSQFVHSDIHIVDIGILETIEHPLVHNRKIAYSTKDMRTESAMTYDEAVQAIWVGIEEVEKLVKQGYKVFGTGEMGIGNTTTSAAVASVLTGETVEKMTGKGAGVKAGTLERKVRVIEEAIAFNKPNQADPIDVVAKVGGFDLAGLCGVFLGAAKNKKAVVIDGFIASAAALLAYKLEPKVKHYMFASHLSKEAGMQTILDYIGLEAPFNLEMRLGEGSGCPLFFQLMDMANYVLMHMGTFEEAAINKDKYMDIWK